MRILFMAAAAVFASGCGAYYEDVPAFGQSDPTVPYATQQQTVADNPTQIQAVAGQEVSLDQPADADEYTDTDPAALTDFKATLDPYGTWADDSQYGTVWEPDAGVVGNDFEPYVTAGHWTYDDDDYTWVSDYDWGWAPFHYGRWIWIAGRGWCWIAGRRYAGAWVSWRVGEPGLGYIGWGPLAPSWYWRDGRAYDIGWRVGSPYVFCGVGDFFSPSLRGRILAGPQVGSIAGRTRPYDGQRTPAHPTVGPTPSKYGLAPPLGPSITAPGIARARAFARPSTAIAFGARAPAYATRPANVPFASRGFTGVDRPIVSAPQYRGVAPTPYRMPYTRPMQVPYGGRSPSYDRPSGPVYRGGGGGPVYRGGGPMYRGGGARMNRGGPTFDRPAPTYRGGGGHVYRGGGPVVQPSYSHPSYHAPSGGGHFGGGHFGGGHFGGGGGRHR